MNFLAHQLLSADHVEFRLGNFLADFVKGKDRLQFQGEMRRGLDCHRAIDRFTDCHACVFAAMRLVDPARRRFAGILVDLFFDHVLATQWHRYAAGSLDDFAAGIYSSFTEYKGPLPAIAERVIGRMIEYDWLRSYQHMDGIDAAIERVRRILGHERTETLAGASDDLHRQYDAFAAEFHRFFPALQMHIAQEFATW